MKEVLILGGSGMLGRMVSLVLAQDAGINVTATVRNIDTQRIDHPRVKTAVLKIGAGEETALDHLLRGKQAVVNCIGITKPYVKNETSEEIRNAVACNVLFPHMLAEKAAEARCAVYQIATDCVYSGLQGWYDEKSPHDTTDVYGKTKSMGEVKADGFHNLRCSIIGPEYGRGTFLLSWVLNQPKDAELTGYTNHDWNGITTYHFAKLCRGAIRNDVHLPGIQHVVPQGSVNKHQLVSALAAAYGRDDIVVKRGEGGTKCDRTLLTNDNVINNNLWMHAGYMNLPTVPEMIAEMAEWSKDNW